MGAQEPNAIPPTVWGERRVGGVLYRTTSETRVLSPEHYRLDVLHEAFDGDRLVERARAFYINRYVRRETMYRLLEQAGFEIVEEVVAYDGTPFTGTEKRVVIGAKPQRL